MGSRFSFFSFTHHLNHNFYHPLTHLQSFFFPDGKPLPCGPNCDESCTNARIYISNLPEGVTEDEIVKLFSGIGIIARERPKGRGVFKDQVRVN